MNHLGGGRRFDKGTWCPTVWDYLLDRYFINSVLDIGCGIGSALAYFLERCSIAVGIDGDPFVLENSTVADHIVEHDFTKGVLYPHERFDLGWCCEFVEHVEEQYRSNYLATFTYCDRLVLTHALPGQTGYHHVNCKPSEYWIKLLLEWGFVEQPKVSEHLRSLTDALYFRTGMFFVQEKERDVEVKPLTPKNPS